MTQFKSNISRIMILSHEEVFVQHNTGGIKLIIIKLTLNIYKNIALVKIEHLRTYISNLKSVPQIICMCDRKLRET